MSRIFRCALIAAFVLFSMEAYVARFPNLIQKKIEVPSEFNSELEQILGLSKSEFGSRLQCSLSDAIETASVVAKKGSFNSFEDKQPTIYNEIEISTDGGTITIGPYWLDQRTAFPHPSGPQYKFGSKPFEANSSDKSNCWVRINHFLTSVKKDEIVLTQKFSIRSIFGKTQTLKIRRSISDGKVIIWFFLGPQLGEVKQCPGCS